MIVIKTGVRKPVADAMNSICEENRSWIKLLIVDEELLRDLYPRTYDEDCYKTAISVYVETWYHIPRLNQSIDFVYHVDSNLNHYDDFEQEMIDMLKHYVDKIADSNNYINVKRQVND